TASSGEPAWFITRPRPAGDSLTMPTATRDDELTDDKLAGMNLAQLRAEAKVRYERAATIEKKYPDGPISDTDDEAEVKRLLKGIDGVERYLAPLEEHDERKERIFGNVKRYNERAGRVNHAVMGTDGG